MKSVKEWIEFFGYQPLKRIPLKLIQIREIQLDAIHNRYPCKHNVLRYCAICELENK